MSILRLILGSRQTVGELKSAGLRDVRYDCRSRRFHMSDTERAIVKELRRLKPESKVLRFYEEVSE